MQPIILVPARMASTRLPGKPLADIHGAPMIVHVFRRAVAAGLGPVLVATDDAAVVDAVRAAGGQAILTDAAHPSGTDRINEAVEAIDPEGRHDVVINLQGDLPTIAPPAVQAAAALLEDPVVDIGTLAAVITRPAETTDPNIVKVVGSAVGPHRLRALYFTRACAPWGEGPRHHHIGLYAYRRQALRRFVALPPSGLEIRERLEQWRALEAGMRIEVAIVDTVPLGVDTAEELARARTMLDPS